MSDTRIDAPRRILDTIEQAQRQIERIQTEIQAMLFGVQAALDVPDGWQWDGKGWIEPGREPVDDTRG